MHQIVPHILVLNDQYWLPYSLECLRGKFNRYVIYDVGSKDETPNIIDRFVELEKKRGAEFYIRSFTETPHPQIQGIFRNSMIAESLSEWYLIIDGDEVYNEDDINYIADSKWTQFAYKSFFAEYSIDKIYGVVKRIEIGTDLQTRYSELRSHHRLYHQTAIWKGTHPGEEPVFNQNTSREFYLDAITCYHFHNTLRSPLEKDVPSRERRKGKSTYKPGQLIPYNLLDVLPILRKPIANFPVNPELEKLQHDY